MELDAIKSVLSSSIDPTLETTDYRLASVLVVIYGEKPIVIMTEKPKHMKFHAGEISSFVMMTTIFPYSTGESTSLPQYGWHFNLWPSTSFVNMTITDEFCSHTIVQKSSKH